MSFGQPLFLLALLAVPLVAAAVVRLLGLRLGSVRVVVDGVGG